MNLKAGKIILFVACLIFLASGIYAQCNSTQIDINSASASRLDDIYGIGPAKAENIISYRGLWKFNSVDDLINVSGIGSVTLGEIKTQGLACVAVQDNNSVSKNNNTGSNSANNSVVSAQSSNDIQNPNNNSANSATQPINQISSGTENVQIPQKVTTKVIELNPKKSRDSSGTKSQSSVSFWSSASLPIYGLVAFGVLLGALFLARRIKTKRYKSEFS